MKKGFTLVELLIVVVIIIGIMIPAIIGWGMNIYKAFQLDYEPTYKAEVIRIVGVFVPPVGAIAGYCTFAEEEPKE
jgi:prepilin-type N-terminal cleavage/methylation domain-containing protein